MSEVIKSYLTSLGFRVDSSSAGRAEGAMNAFAITAAKAAAVVAGEFSAIGLTAQNLGTCAEVAQGSLTALANKLRFNLGSEGPGSERLFHSLEIQTQEANGKLRETANLLASLGEKLRQKPLPVANASTGGVHPFDLYQRAGKKVCAFQTEMQEFDFTTPLLWEKIASALAKTLPPFISKSRELVEQNLEKTIGSIDTGLKLFIPLTEAIGIGLRTLANAFIALDKATNGWSTALGVVSLAWRALNAAFMLSPLGLLVTMILELSLALGLLSDDFKTWEKGGKSLIDWSKGFGTDLLEISDGFKEIFGWIEKIINSYFVKAFILNNNKKISPDIENNFLSSRENTNTGIANIEQGLSSNPPYSLGLSERGEGSSVFTTIIRSRMNEAGEAAQVVMQKLVELGAFILVRSAVITTNLMSKSNSSPHVTGDDGITYGLAQWRSDQQHVFKELFGHDIRQSTLDKKFMFIAQELYSGNKINTEITFGRAINARKSSEIITKNYEYPKDILVDARTRGELAEKLQANFLNATLFPSLAERAALTGGQGGGAAVLNQATTINVNGAGSVVETVNAVRDAQDRVNGDLYRNVQGAIAG